MPTYEYRCTSCGDRVEAFQRIDEEPLRTCERCGGALRKVFHPAGIVFKGSGFYATDSRKATKPSGDKSGGGEKSGDKTRSGDNAGSSDKGGARDSKADTNADPKPAKKAAGSDS